MPEFSQELEKRLKQQGLDALAQQIASAAIVARCTCHDDFCSSFYTKPTPDGSYPPGYESLDLDAEQGIVRVDAVEGELAHVEVLNRLDVREKLDRHFPL